MSINDSDSGLSVSLDGSHYGGSATHANGNVTYKLDIKIPDLNLKKTASLFLTDTVGMLKKNIITALQKDLKDAMNYGLFIPPVEGKAGKFLLEERPLTEYGLHQSHQVIELRYKRRLYRCTNINITKLKKLHSKTNLKLFMEYVGSGDIGKVSKLLLKGLDPNFQIKETGETPLIKACSLNQPVEIIKILVENGAHLDYRHSNGHTPLHAAAILGNFDAIKILLDLGQSPNTIDLEGLTPLYHSIISDSSAVCMERLLYDYSIIGVEDENGLQEIHQACRFGRTQHLDFLLQYKADINSQTSKNGNTPLHICAYLNQESCARLLLFRGADRFVKNRAGHTAYQQALMSDNKNIAMLIQYYKDEDVVGVRSSPKYNFKRKPSMVPTQIIHRSRSVSGLSDLSQIDKRDDSGFNSQSGHYAGEHSKKQTCSLGKSGGQVITNYMEEIEDRKENYPTCLFDNKKLSRSVNNLQQAPFKNDTTPTESNETASTCLSNWWLDWENEDTDGLSNFSGPSQRRTARNHSRQDFKKKTRSQSCNRQPGKSDLTEMRDIDTNFLPRVVVLQKNSKGFGFVIRGLKASSSITFRPTSKNPALQYFEEVEPNSVAARAGLKRGDFILEINEQSVVSASHEETVRLIKASGDILAMKVVTVDMNKRDEQTKCFDMMVSGIDDSSDGSSIISSEVKSNHMSTFAKSLNRTKPITGVTTNVFGTIKNTNYSSMNSVRQALSFMRLGNYLQNYNIQVHRPSLIAQNLVTNSNVSPSIFSSEIMMSPNVVRVRRNTISTHMRPDSITSTDSFYPMPPPPPTEGSPQKQQLDTIDDFTLKRSRTFPTPISLSEDKPDARVPPSASTQKDNPNPIVFPPADDCPPPVVSANTFGLPSTCLPSSLSVAPPPAPPPPPMTVMTPLSISNNISKPILKAPALAPKPVVINPQVDFDAHLRQAIAKRRQQIDNDQSSVMSLETTDTRCSKSDKRITLNSLKQSETDTRSKSNQLKGGKDPESSNTSSNCFQRSQSNAVYSDKSRTGFPKSDSISRLYLV